MDRHPQHLIARALDAARKQGLTATILKEGPPLGRTQADALVEVAFGAERVLYAAEAKTTVTNATLGAVVHGLGRLGEQALLITEYVTPPLADKLREQRIAFIDTAGNAYLERPPLLIWIKGQRPAGKPAAAEAGRAFQPGGLQLLFILLADPEAVNRPYRELARMAGVAHGTVGWVMTDLQQLGYVHRAPHKQRARRLFNKRKLLGQWTEAYARLLRPRMLLQRYYIATLDGWRDWKLGEHNAAWGGEPAAAILTGYLRPGELTIYGDKNPGMLAARQKFIKEPAPGRTAPVEIRKMFWTLPKDPDHLDVVPPLLVYADLLATGDPRCIETAGLIRNGHLRFLDDE